MTSPKLAVEQPDGTRRYVHPVTSEEVPSVTTVLGMINKPRLPGWAARKAAEYAVRHWDEMVELPFPEKVDQIRLASERESAAARELGTAVHELIEDWGKGIPHENSPRIAGHANQFISFLMKEKPEFTEQEVTLWSRTHAYAGTADFIAVMHGSTYLGDVKTGRNIHPEAAIQVSALAECDFIIREDGSEEPMPVIDFLAVLHIRPRSWHLIHAGNRAENFSAFLAARELWDWEHDTAPVCLGRRNYR